ncbi:hypothetical protein OHB04_11795 [Streptomyces sp. NBC_01775]|uniref:hypothetical protein n=1 Tax=Streptomyces sp. NBC_01775 TaxID=2975939 RepID=UPI002DD8FA12|nr:hypothetical protein [Streptomyces sp. NBC_01775]WSB76403.1 hypothetical protein OHB04_11795 [Streptomyces sp. NBC_01775]
MAEPGGSGGGSGKKSDLRRGGEDVLKKFKKKIDDALSELEKSPGGRKMMEQKQFTEAALRSGSGEFREADALYQRYKTVHTSLTQLSKDLEDQIVAFGVAVLAANGELDKVDADQRREFWQIQKRLGADEPGHHGGGGKQGHHHGGGKQSDKSGDGSTAVDQ